MLPPGSRRVLVAAATGFLACGAAAHSLHPALAGWLPLVLGAWLALLWGTGVPALIGITVLCALCSLLFMPPSPFHGYGVLEEMAHQAVSMKAAEVVRGPWFLPAILLLPAAGVGIVRWLGAPRRRHVVLGVLLFLLANQALQMADFVPGLFARAGRDAPPGAVMRTDNAQYLRILYRMSRGQACYDAQFDTFVFDRGMEPPRYAFGYRMPGLFHLLGWAAAWEPARLPSLYLAFSLATTLGLFALAKTLVPEEAALLPPWLAAPFLAYGLPGIHWLMTEYWALFLWVPALLAFQRRQDGLAALCMSLSAMTREQMLLPALAMLAAGALARPRHHLALLAVPVAVSLATMAAHVGILSLAYPEIVPGGAVTGYHGEGWVFMQRLLAFGAPFYAQYGLLAPVIGLLAVLGMARLPRPLLVALGLPVVGFLLFSYLKGGGWRTYWAILTTPWLLVLAGLSLHLPRRTD